MRVIPLLLACLTPLAAAMPLKKGNTWIWQVKDWNLNYTTWRTAVLLDSSHVDSGTSWSLLVRDSVTGKQDTATLIARRDGSQYWTAVSAWAPWDPAPPSNLDLWKMTNEWGYELYSNGHLPWGGSFLAAYCRSSYDLTDLEYYKSVEPDVPGDYPRSGVTFRGPLRNGIPAFLDYQEFESYGSGMFPAGRWSDSLGFVRGELLPSFDWTLVAFNGKPVVVPVDSLKLPSVGDSLTWLETTIRSPASKSSDTSSSQRSWKILSIKPKIAPGVEVQIEETVTGSSSLPSRHSLALTISPSTRDFSALPVQALGWVRLISDFTTDSGASRISASSYANTGAGLMGSSDSSNARFDLHGNLVEYLVESDAFSFTSLPYSDGGTSTRIRLTSVVRDTIAAYRLQSSLAKLASGFPALPVRWRDLRGRTGQIPASSLTHGHVGSGLLLLDATLPDGTRWSGSLLSTGR